MWRSVCNNSVGAEWGEAAGMVCFQIPRVIRSTFRVFHRRRMQNSQRCLRFGLQPVKKGSQSRRPIRKTRVCGG